MIIQIYYPDKLSRLWCLTSPTDVQINIFRANKANLASSLFIEVPVPKTEKSAVIICVLTVSICPLFTVLIFRVVSTVWYLFVLSFNFGHLNIKELTIA